MEYNDEFVMVRYRKENRLDTVTVKRVRRHTKQNYSDKIPSKVQNFDEYASVFQF